MKKKYYYFTLLLTLFSLLPEVKAQDCIGYIAKPATFTFATVFATVGDMSQILDGEGATGNIADGDGSNPHFYWMTGQNPVTFYIQMNTPSVVNMVKFYGPWGFDEGLKDVTVRLYSGGTLLGTENFVLPSLYSTYHFFDFSTTYTNVTNVQLVAENDYGISTVLRTSLTEVVFGESITNTPPPVKNLTNICPAVTVDLNNAHIGSIPSDKSLVWYTDDQKAGAPLAGAAITQAGAGTYYAFYYDSVNNCYSPVSDAVIVNIINTLDSDGDGIPDYCDWDDDNDGILDADESPECYYTASEAHVITSVSSGFAPSNGNNILALYDGSTSTTTSFTFSSSQTITSGGVFFTIKYNQPVTLTSVTTNSQYYALTTTDATEYGMLYGSIDGITYTALNTSGTNLYGTVRTFTNTLHPATHFQYYQIRYIGKSATGTTATVTLGANKILEITSALNATDYQASNNPKPGVCASDLDGDGIPNHLDLDSDNDGCTDAIEGGGNFSSSQLVTAASTLSVGTGSTAANQNLCASGACVDANGIPTIAGISGQGIGYSDNANIKMCTDSDGDGVPDVCDLDDDNDGILDVNENNCDSAVTKNIRIGYIPNSRSLASDNGYTFDGAYMSGSGALKLTDPSNFGPSGTVNANITLVAITADPITKADIDVLNLNAIFIGGIDYPPTVSYLADSELSSIKDWSDDAASNFVVVTQTASKAWGSTITSGNINPDTPTSFGTETPIFNGPFGTISSFSQGGSYQAYFATLNGACSTQKLAVDNSNRTVMYLDGIYNDLIIADVDILTTLGGVTSGSAITSNNDKLFGNIWAFVVSQSSCYDVDTDGDGIPDRLDLDSDNDGCPDAIEGGGNFTADDLTTASGDLTSQSVNQNFGVTVDANGIPVIVGASGQGVGNSKNSNINDCPFPNVCTTGNCNENAFLFTSDPNTLEYDNLISGFHSTMAKQKDGNYLIWGQGAKPNTFGEHLYEPTVISPENGFNYTGEILKATLGTYGSVNDGYDQYAVITTDGLYIWGGNSILDVMVHRSVKGTTTFDKMTDTNITNADPATGLPIGVAPTEVKMLFGSYATLGIVTCTGEAYVISYKGNKNGDGTSDVAAEFNKWHRVSVGPDQPLNRIVAMRGVPGAMVALTYEGDLYTWGRDTYLGDGTAKANRLYATKMTLPAGVTPKMIGMTKAGDKLQPHTLNSYYLLSTTGEVYSLGDNSKKQLGTFDNIERTQWVNVKSTDASTNMTDIVWFSPNEHDAAGHATVTALTADGKLWGWGMNHGNMLGSETGPTDPKYMFGALDHDEKVLAIETGGHINTIFKDCDFKLGYIGHSSNGSYANTSTSTGSTSDVFKFDGAKLTNLCAIYTPPFPEVSNMRVCYGETADLTDAMLNSAPAGYTLEWWTTINRISGTEVADPTSVETGTYYAFFASDVDDCPQLEGQEVIVKENPLPVVPQNLANIKSIVGNNVQFTVPVSGYTVTWEYATITAPTVWNTLDNTTFSGTIVLTGTTFNISNATKAINGIKVRLKAVSDKDCVAYSNEIQIEIVDRLIITNPILRSKAKK